MNWIIWIMAASLSSAALKTLHNSLDPKSVTEQLAFYRLYPETQEGHKALSHAWTLLGTHGQTPIDLPEFDIQPLIAFVNRQPFDPQPEISEDTLCLIEQIGSTLQHRTLRGHQIWNIEDLYSLTSEEIDLARALLLYQFENRREIQSYEANIDLMALQIAARLKKNANHQDKVRAISDFIFLDMGFRFPPHSLWSDDVDVYTILPSIMDSRQGVCLGVSILYLSLAQRLGLPLEIVTPPGHIYIRYREDEKNVINIETTARGIHVPCKQYKGINTHTLHERTLKEVIGLSFMNQAAVCWHREDYTRAIDLYEKAIPYLPGDALLNTFLGINYLFVGQTAKGIELLKTAGPVPGSINGQTFIEDYLAGHVDTEGIKAIFMSVNETRTSIQNKQARLQKIIKNYPKFRDGWLHLAITHIQLGHAKLAVDTLEKCHQLDPGQASIEYYLAQLKMQRMCFKDAWKHLILAEKITGNYQPLALKQLRHMLRILYPTG